MCAEASLEGRACLKLELNAAPGSRCRRRPSYENARRTSSRCCPTLTIHSATGVDLPKTPNHGRRSAANVLVLFTVEELLVTAVDVAPFKLSPSKRHDVLVMPLGWWRRHSSIDRINKECTAWRAVCVQETRRTLTFPHQRSPRVIVEGETGDRGGLFVGD